MIRPTKGQYQLAGGLVIFSWRMGHFGEVMLEVQNISKHDQYRVSEDWVLKPMDLWYIFHFHPKK
jgi:hypothetical protein